MVGVLIDTVSIQNYIFSSNKLIENVGASYLVEQIYEEYLKDALRTFHSTSPNLDTWKNNPSYMNFSPYGIGYIGGGNALILFEVNNGKHKEFIKNFTNILLEKTPGLRTSFGINPNFNLNNSANSFTNSMKEIHKNLKKNKNIYFPIITLPKYGITADCPFSGESAEIYYKDKWISNVSKVKIEAGEKSLSHIQDMLKDELGETYTFTNEIDKLGQVEHKNYIAVVHIDGNNMGKRFEKCNTLKELRNLSIRVKENTQKAFKETIEDLVGLIENRILGPKNNFHFHTDGNGKTILPIRPIIIGGDDITFVCDGRLGVYLAEKFITKFSEQQIKGEKLSACAGVSIVKTKYPFYRAYQLSEQLCENAKKESRKEENSSYLDFLISSRGFSGTLEEIRERSFKIPYGLLPFGPYRIDNNTQENSIYHLKGGIKFFNNWTRTKIEQLREVTTKSESEIKMFVKEMDIKGYTFYEIPYAPPYSEDIRVNDKTPYFDIIELMDFYPKELL